MNAAMNRWDFNDWCKENSGTLKRIPRDSKNRDFDDTRREEGTPVATSYKLLASIALVNREHCIGAQQRTREFSNEFQDLESNMESK